MNKQPFKNYMLILLVMTTIGFAAFTQSGVFGQVDCSDTVPPRLTVGQPARVTPGEPNRVRANPSTEAELLGTIYGGQTILVLDGPACSDGYVWWQISTFYETGNIIRGWTVEGTDASYWLEPLPIQGLLCEPQHNPTWEDDTAYSGLASTAADLGFHETAIALYTCAIEFSTYETPAFPFFRGMSYAALERYEEALADFNHMIETDPLYYNAFVERARVYFRQGDYRQALDEVNHIIASNWSSLARYQAFLLRGDIHMELGYYENARTDFENALQEEMYSSYQAVPPLIGLGDVFTSQEDYSRAAFLYYQALDIQNGINSESPLGDFTDTHLRLGDTYYALGFYPQALGQYQAYLSRVDGEPTSEITQRIENIESQGVTAFFPHTESVLDPVDASTAVEITLPIIHYGCGLAWSPQSEFIVFGNLVIGYSDELAIIHQYGTELPFQSTFSPDGMMLAMAYEDAIRIWDVATEQLIAELSGNSAVAFSPDGSLLASGSSENNVLLWDVATQSLRTSLEGHTAKVNSVAFSPDGLTLVSASDWGDEPIRFWDVMQEGQTAQLDIGSRVYDAVFSSDGRYLLVGDYYNVSLWDVETKTPLGVFTDQGLNFTSVAFAPDSMRFAANVGTRGRIWSAETGEVLREFQETSPYSSTPIQCLAFSPDGEEIAVMIGASKLAVWSLEDL